MIATISQPRYMPYLGYFHRIALSDIFVVLDTVQFKTREWDRRNKIRVHQGEEWTWLTVPVQKASRNSLITEIRIDNRQSWQEKHWQTLESSYRKAPYFGMYAADLRLFYMKDYEFIRDLNVELTRYFCDRLGISTKMVLASELQASGRSTDLLVNLCRAVHADTYWSGVDGCHYIDEERFGQAGITLTYQEYKHPTYEQIHGLPFIPNMAIVDLLFNCGPGSLEVLRRDNEGPIFSTGAPAKAGSRCTGIDSLLDCSVKSNHSADQPRLTLHEAGNREAIVKISSGIPIGALSG